MMSRKEPLSIGQCATMACFMEATTAKPGNVHRGADFDDLTYQDLMTSAVMIAPAMDAAGAGEPLGRSILRAIHDTQSAVSTNTNLGMVLLFTPLAKVPREVPLVEGIETVLSALDAQDAKDIYEAIRIAQPGSLGNTPQYDVTGPAPDDLLTAMQAAADRDMVARQYAENFSQVLGEVVPWIQEGLALNGSLSDVIVRVHVRLMSKYPDSLIARKLGIEAAQESANRAATTLNAGEPGEEPYHQALADLDFWLRSDGHRRNPGTTADLVTAGLFAALRDGIISMPFRWSSPMEG